MGLGISHALPKPVRTVPTIAAYDLIRWPNLLGSPRVTSRRSSKMETTLTKLAVMTASARVDLQVTTRRRHEFQCLLDLARKITARPIIAATTVKLVFLRM